MDLDQKPKSRVENIFLLDASFCASGNFFARGKQDFFFLFPFFLFFCNFYQGNNRNLNRISGEEGI